MKLGTAHKRGGAGNGKDRCPSKCKSSQQNLTLFDSLRSTASLCPLGRARRYGIRGLVIDPYNELDHARAAYMTETEYVSKMLSMVGAGKLISRVRVRVRV